MGERRDPGDPGERRERWARWALLALIALPFAVYVPRVLGGRTPVPASPAPAWVQLVFVTASHWPPPSRLAGHEPWSTLDRRATRHPQVYTPAPSPAAAAASLWTGRWPAAHGVLTNQMALESGAWTLAEAARRSGAATGAFLQEPFVSATQVGGFATVVEDASAPASALAARAAGFLAEHVHERSLVWVHLTDAGERGADVAEVVRLLWNELDRNGNRSAALTVITGFGTRIAQPAAEDDRSYRVPFWVQLPTGLYAGRRSGGAASLVDLAGTLVREPLALPLPDVAHGEAPTQSRAANFANALKGGGGYEWLLVQGPEGELLRFGKTRAVITRRPARGLEDVSFWHAPDPAKDRGFQPVRDPGRLAELGQQYRDLAARAQTGSTPAEPASVPEAWRGKHGW